jgi:tyrosyl-DNA phosphodiesterase 1
MSENKKLDDEKNSKSKKRKFQETDLSEESQDEKILSKKKKISGSKKKSSDPIELNHDELDLILEENEKITENQEKLENELNLPRIKTIYYINANKLTRDDLKDGRRIFNNKTEMSGYAGFQENFIEFRQLFYENLRLNEDFTDNPSEKWTMESAVFSTFCYDDEFIEPLIMMNKIKSLIIKHEESGAGFKPLIEKNDLITFVHPKVDFTMKWGKFHSKLTIFKFPNFLRVIIPTANLTSGDWYFWGQLVWFQDFPLKKGIKNENVSLNNSNFNNLHEFLSKGKLQNQNQSKNQTTGKTEFEIYFDKMFDYLMPANYKTREWFKKLNINFNDYDFSDTCVDLVASSSGRFSLQSKDDYGVGRLMQLSKKYSSHRKSLTNSNSKLTVQCSSIGKSLKDKFLADLGSAFHCKQSTNIDIVFPTVKYVKSFPLGPQLSSCLFLGYDAFNSNREKFKQLELLPEHEKCKTIFHSKFIIASESNNEGEIQITDNTIFYFGSHNLSLAAWGNFEKNDSQVSMANFELGVVFNPIKLRYEEKIKLYKSLILNLNSKSYEKDDIAWIQEFL